MRDPGEILPTVYVLEDRKLPDGEWATCDSHDLYETIEGAEDTAKEWREMSYDDGNKYDVRIVCYRRERVIDPNVDKDEPTTTSATLTLRAAPSKHLYLTDQEWQQLLPTLREAASVRGKEGVDKALQVIAGIIGEERARELHGTTFGILVVEDLLKRRVEDA